MSIERTLMTALPVDQRGHKHFGNREKEPGFEPRLDANVMAFTKDDGEGGEKVVKHADIAASSHPFSCDNCDAYPYFGFTDSGGDPRLFAYAPCPAPNGTPSTNYLFVPSGKIVIANDLRPLYDAREPRGNHSPDFNSAVGQAIFVQQMAAIGCAYVLATNTSVDLVRTAADTYIVGNQPWDDDIDDAAPYDGDVLAHVSCDLWAVCLADYADYTAKVAAASEDEVADHERRGDVQVVDVTPGTYRVDVHATEGDFDEHDGEPGKVYADITLVSAPMPRIQA